MAKAKQATVDEKINNDLILLTLLNSFRSYESSVKTYYALQPTQRFHQEPHLRAAQERFENAIFSVIDWRVKIIIADLTGKRLADSIELALEKQLAGNVKSKILDILMNPEMIEKIQGAVEPVTQVDGKKNYTTEDENIIDDLLSD